MSAAADSGRADFLPDFCAPRTVLAVVLVSELVAIAIALARPTAGLGVLTDLAHLSLFLQWLALTSAALLCVGRPRLARLGSAAGGIAAFALLMANVLLITELTYWAGRLMASRGVPVAALPERHGPFLLDTLGIGAVVIGLLLRYFYVAHQWRLNVEQEARSRIHALQARIRPHFLFNSMNTIAALIRSRPEAAEGAVEDLADLFRVSLADARNSITLDEELEIARTYERIERLRLGERLKVRWAVDGLPGSMRVPPLTVQPLLENAIHHGVEPIPEGGEIRVDGRLEQDRVVIEVSNPLPAAGTVGREGNRLALSNIRQRLELFYGRAATVIADREGGRFLARIEFPSQA